MKRNFTRAFQEFIADNPHIKEVHYDKDGNYHLNVYEEQVPITNDKGGFLTKPDGSIIKKKTGKTVAAGGKKYIVDSVSREDILDQEQPEEKAPLVETKTIQAQKENLVENQASGFSKSE